MASVFKKKRDKRRKGSSWYICYKDSSDKWVTIKGCVDHEATRLMANELEAQSGLERRGIVTGSQSRCAKQGKRPIAEHIDEFVATKEGKGRADRYVQQIRGRLEAFVEFISCKLIPEITAERATAFVLDLRGRKCGKTNMSSYTIREYVNTLRAFTAWAVLTARLQSDPLVTLGRLDTKALRATRPRRALSPDEIGAMLEVTLTRPLDELRTIRTGPRKGQKVANVSPEAKVKAESLGRDRHVAYLTLLWTGLRRSELGAIEWGDVGLDNLPAKLELRKGLDKSKRGDTIALHPQVAELLRGFKPSKAKASDRVFRTVPGMKVLRADLIVAGIPFETRDGRVDLHSMRKSVNTYLAAHGVPQRIAQAHMRHKDPRLTAGAYTDESQLPIASAISGLPDLPTRRASEKRTSRRKAAGNA
ncbi:MAG: tyrosine-type recombinase/integrase [Planctomycetes bacterium]|nr:tyrosine-type recombinase/integrase [Planctomycetota bacterium]